MATKRTSQRVRPVYEDFKPEMMETQDDHLLQIHLPGFTTDQVRITYMNYTGDLNVSGERPLDRRNYRWSRFNESYSVPLDCEVPKIQAKLSREILTITMPKKSISQVKSPSPSMIDQSEKPRQDIPPKPTTTRGGDSEPEKAHQKIPRMHIPNRVEEEKPGKAQEKIPQKNEEEASSQRRTEAQKKPTDEKGLKGLFPPESIREPRPQKGEDEVESKPILITAPRRPVIEKPDKGPFETQQEPRKPINDGKSDSDKRKSEKMFVEKEIRTRKEAPKPLEKEKEIRTRKEAPKLPEKEKEKEISSKEDIIGTIGKGIKLVSASATQVVTKISERRWNEEDKSVLANMGAAVIVIAAIGAYWSYRFGSSGKT